MAYQVARLGSGLNAACDRTIFFFVLGDKTVSVMTSNVEDPIWTVNESDVCATGASPFIVASAFGTESCSSSPYVD